MNRELTTAQVLRRKTPRAYWVRSLDRPSRGWQMVVTNKYQSFKALFGGSIRCNHDSIGRGFDADAYHIDAITEDLRWVPIEKPMEVK